MAHKAGYVVALAVGGLLATVGLAQRPERAVAAGPADRAAAQPTRWEYATLRFKFMSGKWEWLSGDQSVTAEKIEVYRALGGVPRGDNREISYIDVANQAAAHGWEMLTIHYRDTGSEIVFKRPVR